MALKSHPDRAASTGLDEELLTKNFRAVQDAYSVIKESYPQTKPVTKQFAKERKSQHAKDFFYKNSMPPNYSLRFGEFLYYNKIISWNTLIEALVHHKSSDKLFGSYFIEKGILSNSDVRKYLRLNREHNIKIKK